MMRCSATILTIVSIGFLSLHARSQTKAECEAIMKKADSAIGKRNYPYALAKLRAYKICSPDSASAADNKILFVFDKINGERKAADSARKAAVEQTNRAIREKNNALRKAESSRLLSLALQKLPTNPTKAVRLAEQSLKTDNENGSASAFLENTLSNNNTCYYSRVLKVSNEIIDYIDISSDGRYLLVTSAGSITLWNTDGVRVDSQRVGDYISRARFVPDDPGYDFIAITSTTSFPIL